MFYNPALCYAASDKPGRRHSDQTAGGRWGFGVHKMGEHVGGVASDGSNAWVTLLDSDRVAKISNTDAP
jgi:hypothetical protein